MTNPHNTDPQHTNPHDQSIAHLRLVAIAPGYWELRALERRPGQVDMLPRGSYFLLYAAGSQGISDEQLEKAIEWADRHDQQAREVFLGMNPRVREGGKGKADVATLTCCYTELDLPGEPVDDALAALQTFSHPPSFVVHSGHGLHVVWLLRVITVDKLKWRAVQKSIHAQFAGWGADPSIRTDEARVLRLVPYPNRKFGEAVPTSIVYEGADRYTLEDLASAFAATSPLLVPASALLSRQPMSPVTPPTVPTPTSQPIEPAVPVAALEASEALEPAELTYLAHAPPVPVPVVDEQLMRGISPDLLRQMAHDEEERRQVLLEFIIRNLRPGIDYGTIPGTEGTQGTQGTHTKPALLKPGAEKVCLLLQLRPDFVADLDTLTMLGSPMGIFAYVCRLFDRGGRVVGQGRGVSELREQAGWTVNVAVKMAQKRAQVDAVLRVAGLSEFFSHEEESMVATAASAPSSSPESTGSTGGQDQELTSGTGQPAPDLCTPEQATLIRALLPRVGWTEADFLERLKLSAIRDLPRAKAYRAIERLQEMARAIAARDTPNTPDRARATEDGKETT